MKFRRMVVLLLTMMLLSNMVFMASAELPEPYAYFNDFAGVLGDTEEEAINQELLNIRSTLGFDFVIVTTKDIGDETPKGYAVALFEAWGIGDAERDNGLLLLNVTEGEQRSILFEVGYGLEGVFTDVSTGQILDEMIPYLSEGDYQNGYKKAIALVVAKANNQLSNDNSGNDYPEENRQNNSVGLLVFGLVLLYLFLLLIARVTHQWWLYDILWLILRMLFRGGGRGGFGGGGGFGGFGGGSSGGGGSSRSY